MESSPFKIERFDYLCSKKMKRAIIIGATSGIGKEVAQRLLSEGWQIGIAGRRQSGSRRFPANRTGTDKNSITGRHSGRQCRKAWMRLSINWAVWIYFCSVPASVSKIWI